MAQNGRASSSSWTISSSSASWRCLHSPLTSYGMDVRVSRATWHEGDSGASLVITVRDQRSLPLPVSRPRLAVVGLDTLISCRPCTTHRLNAASLSIACTSSLVCLTYPFGTTDQPATGCRFPLFAMGPPFSGRCQAKPLTCVAHPSKGPGHVRRLGTPWSSAPLCVYSRVPPTPRRQGVR